MVAVSGGWPKGVMLAPEAANNTSWAINYFGVSAPYLQANITDYTTPTNILARYPNAFSLILLNFINTNIPAIVAGSTAGNIYLFNCWYSNANTTAIFQMQTNSPPNAFYAGPPWATNAP
jgi:hypothetical protein